MRIESLPAGDGPTRSLHARLTVLPGLGDDERARLVQRLATAVGVDAAEIVLQAADLPGAVAGADAPSDGPDGSHDRREEEEATTAAAMAQAEASVAAAEGDVASARRHANDVDQQIADARDALAARRVELDQLEATHRDLVTAAPEVVVPTDEELRAAAMVVQSRRAELAQSEDVRAEAPQELVDALEAAHAAVLEAEERGGWRGRRQLAELRAREAAAAAAVGVTSYEAWLVRSSGLLPQRDESRIAAAGLELEHAEARVVELESRLDDTASREHAARLAALDAAIATARHALEADAAALAALDGRRDEARDALVAAEQALAEARTHRDAVAAVRAERQPRHAAAPVADVSKVEPAALELTLLSRLVAHESSGYPLLIDDAFGGLDPARRDAALEVLAWASEAVQVVYLEPGRAMADRAAHLGPESAAVLDLRPVATPAGAASRPDVPEGDAGAPPVSSESTTTEAAP